LTILGIDTSGPVAGVALFEGGKVRYCAAADVGLTHSETLMPLIDRALEASGLSIPQLGLIACVAGPGSFTGVRIGVCAARAISMATGIPCAQIDALEALAAGAFGFDGEICPILDARRGQVYCARFRFSQGVLPQRIADDRAMALEEFIEQLPASSRLLFVGDGVWAHAPAIERALGSRALIQKPHLSGLRADAACYLAHNNPALHMPGMQLLPLYLRKPQAERAREAARERRP
jgi:tRNA threonylcarbamoyladenosine biosynthesis protein TsaB